MSLTVFKLILCLEVTLYTVVVVRKIMVSESKIIFWFSLEAPFTSLLDQGYGSHITCSDPLDIFRSPEPLGSQGELIGWP